MSRKISLDRGAEVSPLIVPARAAAGPGSAARPGVGARLAARRSPSSSCRRRDSAGRPGRRVAGQAGGQGRRGAHQRGAAEAAAGCRAVGQHGGGARVVGEAAADRDLQRAWLRAPGAIRAVGARRRPGPATRPGRRARMPASVASRGRAAAACRISGRQIISTVPAAASRGASAVCPSSRPTSAMTSAGAAANAAASAGQAAAICHSASGPAGAGSTNWRQAARTAAPIPRTCSAAARASSLRASSAYRSSPALAARPRLPAPQSRQHGPAGRVAFGEHHRRGARPGPGPARWW